jgi:sugar/nucleoside kinase (ribokinase family)
VNSDASVVANINMDFVFEVNNFSKPGETMRSYNFKRYSGGEGDNQALATLTLSTGLYIRKDKSKKVNMKPVEIRECSTGLAFIVVK